MLLGPVVVVESPASQDTIGIVAANFVTELASVLVPVDFRGGGLESDEFRELVRLGMVVVFHTPPRTGFLRRESANLPILSYNRHTRGC